MGKRPGAYSDVGQVYVHVLDVKIYSALVEISPDFYEHILLDMSSNKNKASAVELKQQI